MPVPAPTAGLPVPAPTRMPIVAVSVGMAGVTCAEYDTGSGTGATDDTGDTIIVSVLDGIISGATFSDPVCSDITADSVEVYLEVSASIDTYTTAGYASLFLWVSTELNLVVSDGSFTTAIVTGGQPPPPLVGASSELVGRIGHRRDHRDVLAVARAVTRADDGVAFDDADALADDCRVHEQCHGHGLRRDGRRLRRRLLPPLRPQQGLLRGQRLLHWRQLRVR